MAFQITDDILGIWGDPSVTGKSAATDILSKKKTLPALLGLGHPTHGAALREIYRQPLLEQKHVARVLELLDAGGVRAETQRRADEFRAVALDALDSTRLKNRAMERLRESAEMMNAKGQVVGDREYS